MAQLSRRMFLSAAGAATVLGGCAPTSRDPRLALQAPMIDPMYMAMYGPMPDEEFPLPPIDVADVDPQWLRQEVAFAASEPVGTIVIDPDARHLYLVRERGRAIRYGVGVGREGYGFRGAAIIGRKAKWPRWTPTPNMIAEDPEKNGPWAKGMEGGLGNPLGARALYLYADGRDTLYRIHGTNEPDSIGKSVSSGCIRLFNHDIIDLYGRTPVGSRVVVRPAAAPKVARRPRATREAMLNL